MFIATDPDRTEHDDFVLNVRIHMDPNDSATPVYVDGIRVGWEIN